MTDTQSLLKRLFNGEQRALSRLITLIERRENYLELMSQIQEKCGHAKVVGITGPPGSGKSTLTDQMTFHLRQAGKKVGIVAIDPSSPFSGGAVLGDRIRMQRHSQDDGVFIRSLGSRGSHGGLSRATRDVVKLFDAFGMDFVLVETVGVGQTELDIMEIADTTLVVLTPESGDTIQTMKAGLLEIADIFIVNKSDRSGADRIKADLEMMIHLGTESKKWTVPVLLTQGDKGTGVGEILDQIQNHQKEKVERKGHGAGSLVSSEVREIVLEELKARLDLKLATVPVKEGANPYKLAEDLLKDL